MSLCAPISERCGATAPIACAPRALFRQHDALLGLLKEAGAHLIAAAAANLRLFSPAVDPVCRGAESGRYHSGRSASRTSDSLGICGSRRASSCARRISVCAWRCAATAGRAAHSRPHNEPFAMIEARVPRHRDECVRRVRYGPLRRPFDDALARGLRRPVARTVVTRKVATCSKPSRITSAAERPNASGSYANCDVSTRCSEVGVAHRCDFGESVSANKQRTVGGLSGHSQECSTHATVEPYSSIAYWRTAGP